MKELRYISTSFSSNNTFEKINDEFVKATISIMSCDQIANGTKFTKESVEKASSTLNYAPVIGFFNGDDFEGHSIEYIVTDTEVKQIVKTVPFGVVIKDTQRWEKIHKPNGEVEDYFMADCYLWGRYEEAIKKVKENKCNQSMEVICNSGKFNEEDGYFEVKDFSFSGLCILGENVTPAFNLAKIRTSENFSKIEVSTVYQEMLYSLNTYLNAEDYDGGGSEMDKSKEFNEELNETEEDFKKKRCAEEEDEEFKKKKCAEDEEEDEFKRKKCENEEDYQSKYEEVNNELISLKAKYSDLQAEYEDLKDRYTALESEVAELRDFALEENVFSKFEVLKNVEGYEAIYNARYDLSEEDLVLRLKALAYDNGIVVGKKSNRKEKEIKKFSLDVNNPKNNKGKVTEWDTLNLNKK